VGGKRAFYLMQEERFSLKPYLYLFPRISWVLVYSIVTPSEPWRGGWETFIGAFTLHGDTFFQGHGINYKFPKQKKARQSTLQVVLYRRPPLYLVAHKCGEALIKIKKNPDLINKSCCSIIKGNSINIFEDRWLLASSHLHRPTNWNPRISHVSQFLTADDWDWDRALVTNLFENEQARAILQMPPNCYDEEGSDKLICLISQDGRFSARSFHKLIHGQRPSPTIFNSSPSPPPVLASVWKNNNPLT